MFLTAFLFPGQASMVPGALRALAAADSAATRILRAAEEASHRHFGVSLDRWLGPAAEPPDVPASQLLHVATDLAVYRMLVAHGAQPHVLMGHSLGEIAALCAADVMNVEQAMDVVCLRVKALQTRATPGGLVALSTDRRRAEAVVALAGDGVSLAAASGPNQCVLSVIDGAGPKLDAILAAAAVSNTRLDAPFPFHGPGVSAAAEQFSRALEGFRFAPPTLPVHSPIFGATAWNDPSRVATLLGRALVDPVEFEGAVRTAWSLGARCFVECGALRTLTSLAERALAGEAGVRTVATVLPGAEPVRGVLDAAATLREGREPHRAEVSVRLRELLSEANALLASPTDRSSNGVEARPARPSLPTTASEPAPRPRPPSPSEVADVAPSAPALSLNGRHAPESTKAPLRPSEPEILSRLVQVLQRVTEYPADVFEPHAEFEADLGIDSLKQVEVFTAVQKEFGLPEREVPTKEYNTLTRVAALVAASLSPNGVA